MANYSEWNFSKSQKLRIYLIEDEQYFDGEFHSMNSERTRITMNKVTRYPDLRYFQNEYHFFRTEVKEIVAQQPEEGMEAVLDPYHGRSLAHHKVLTHAHLYRMSGQSIATKKTSLDVKRSHEMYPHYQKLFENYIIVDKIDNHFLQLVDELSKATMIGVSLEGELLGRKGKLCWVNVASETHTILFDILVLGKDAFDKGLKGLLQSNTVTKVIHDCRMAADCLLHQYSVKIVNVIDTQVLDLIVLRNQMDRQLSFVNSLNDCLQRYLQVPEALLTFPLLREHHLRLDTRKWTMRPLEEESLSLAVQNVVFLMDLRKAQLRALMEPIRQASDLYVSLVSSMSADEATSYYGCIHMAPKGVYNAGKKHNRQGDRGMERLNPNIRYSRDVMHYFDSQEDTLSVTNDTPESTPQIASNQNPTGQSGTSILASLSEAMSKKLVLSQI